jgi:hypothetical protein
VHFRYPVLWGDAKTVADYGNFSGLPTSFLVDRKGLVRKIYPGAASEQELRQDILEVLNP